MVTTGIVFHTHRQPLKWNKSTLHDTQKLYKSSYRESTLLKLAFVSKFPAFYAVDEHRIAGQAQ